MEDEGWRSQCQNQVCSLPIGSCFIGFFLGVTRRVEDGGQGQFSSKISQGEDMNFVHPLTGGYMPFIWSKVEGRKSFGGRCEISEMRDENSTGSQISPLVSQLFKMDL